MATGSDKDVNVALKVTGADDLEKLLKKIEKAVAKFAKLNDSFDSTRDNQAAVIKRALNFGTTSPQDTASLSKLRAEITKLKAEARNLNAALITAKSGFASNLKRAENLTVSQKFDKSDTLSTLQKKISLQAKFIELRDYEGKGTVRAQATMDKLVARQKELIALKRQGNDLENQLAKIQEKMAANTSRFRVARGVDDPKGLTDKYKIALSNVKLQQKLAEIEGASDARKAQLIRREQALTNAAQQTNEAFRKRIDIQRLLDKVGITDQAQRQKFLDQDFSKSHAQLAAKATFKRIQEGSFELLKIQGLLSANYMALNAGLGTLRAGARYVLELDDAFAKLQAITNSSDTTMKNLSKTVVEISKNTRYTAVELAGTAQVLAQAGLSAAQIAKTLPGIAQLATASGSDTETVANLTTTALTVFNKTAAETPAVVGTLASALNLSKLTIEQLGTAFQYAGSTAGEAGLSLEEMTATLAGMSQQGIKSGSTLGTGLRQIMISLITPTEDFKYELKQVGLTMDDVDLRTHTFLDVMETLKNAGFGAASAYKAFETRGASAFIALQAQLPNVRSFQEQMYNSKAAVEGNEKAMESFSAKLGKFTNLLGAQTSTAFAPVLAALKALFDGLNSLLTTVPLVTVAFNALGASLAFISGASLLSGLSKLSVILKGVSAASVLAFAVSPLGKFVTAVTLVGGGLTLLADHLGVTTSKMDKLNGSIEETTASIEEQKQRVLGVDQAIGDIHNKYESLAKNGDDLQAVVRELNQKFKDQGFYVDDTKASVDSLIASLITLKGEQAQLMVSTGNKLALDQLIKADLSSRKGVGVFGVGNKIRDIFPEAAIDRASSIEEKNSQLAKINALIAQRNQQVAPLKKINVGEPGFEQAQKTIKATEKLTDQLVEVSAALYASIKADELVAKASLETSKEFNTKISELDAIARNKKGDTLSDKDKAALLDVAAKSSNGKMTKGELERVVDQIFTELQATQANTRSATAPSRSEEKAAATAAERRQKELDAVQLSSDKLYVKNYEKALKSAKTFSDIDKAISGLQKATNDFFDEQVAQLEKKLKAAGKDPEAQAAYREKLDALRQARSEALEGIDDKRASSTESLFSDRGRGESTRRMHETIQEGIQAWDKLGEAQRTVLIYGLADAVDYASENVGGLFKTMIDGTKSVKEAFRDMAKGILDTMLTTITNSIAQDFTSLLLGPDKGAGKESGGSFLKTVGSFFGFSSMKDGGFVRAADGYAVPTRDSVPALLRPGEIVLRNSAVERLGRDGLLKINAQGNKVVSESGKRMALAGGSDSPGNSVVNVYVVAPGQQPTMSKDDVIVTIAEDMARGGKTRQLVKSIVIGK